MTTLVDHARSLIEYTIWADSRILTTAEGLSEEQYSGLRHVLEHMLGTQGWWHAQWTGDERVEPHLPTLAEARERYAASHRAIRAYAEALTAKEWDRSEQWWRDLGFEQRMPLGESITQVFYHGVQHRSEVAVELSSLGHSPGDVDYLTFLMESGRVA